MCYFRIPDDERVVYKISQLPITKNIPGTNEDNDIWYDHPSEPLSINAMGDHVFDKTKSCFITLKEKAYINHDYVKIYFSWKGSQKQLGRLALECFTGNILLKGEVCDHINGDRRNNSINSLRAASFLFNANNKRLKTISRSGITGVLERDNHFIATVRQLTPGFPTISKSKSKCFYYDKDDEDGKDKARCQASEWRQKHYLATD